MIALVTKADVDQYKYIADSIKNWTQWTQFVIEAQMFDVKNWLGDALLDEILTQAGTVPTTLSTVNQKLFDGGNYDYSDCTFTFYGLKVCIMYYAFARFTNRTPFNYTAAGIVQKDSDFSTPATDKHIQRLETESRLMADAVRDEIILFLNRNCADYPLWKSGCACGRKSTGRMFKVVGD